MEQVIKVNTVRLKEDVAEIKSNINGIERLIEDLKGHNAALDSMWDGPSSEEFKAAFNDDIVALEQLVGALKSMNDYERNAREQYDICEGKVEDLVNQIKIG